MKRLEAQSVDHPVGLGRLWWTQVATLRTNGEASTSHFVWENKGKVARKIWETMRNPIEMEVIYGTLW